MISDRLKKVIFRQLGLDDFDINDTTTAPEVPGWDSLAHIGILAGVEKEYGIHFRTLEVIRLRTIGDLQTIIDRKCMTH